MPPPPQETDPDFDPYRVFPSRYHDQDTHYYTNAYPGEIEPQQPPPPPPTPPSPQTRNGVPVHLIPLPGGAQPGVVDPARIADLKVTVATVSGEPEIPGMLNIGVDRSGNSVLTDGAVTVMVDRDAVPTLLPTQVLPTPMPTLMPTELDQQRQRQLLEEAVVTDINHRTGVYGYAKLMPFGLDHVVTLHDDVKVVVM